MVAGPGPAVACRGGGREPHRKRVHEPSEPAWWLVDRVVLTARIYSALIARARKGRRGWGMAQVP